MADSSRFDFCPKCGALARDGVCQSCGYQLPGVVGKTIQNQDLNTQNAGQQQNTAKQQNAAVPQRTAEQQNAPIQPKVVEQQAAPLPNMGQPQNIQVQGTYAPQPVYNQVQGGFTAQPQNNQPQGVYTGQHTYIAQPQNNQPQGMYLGQPQPGQVQGIPFPGQQPQGQQLYTGQPQNNQAQAYTVQPRNIQGQPQQAVQMQGVPMAGQQPQGQPVYTAQPQFNQAPYAAQPIPSNTQGYSPYMQAVPPEIKKKGSKKTAIIVSIVIGVVVLALVVLILLVAGNVFKTSGLSNHNGSGDLGSSKDKYVEESSDEYSEPEEAAPGEESEPVSAEPKYRHDTVDTTSDNMSEGGQDTSSIFYSGPYNDLKEDLSYQIGFKKESCYVTTNPNIGIEIEYPQIMGADVNNRIDINNALYYEYSYYEDILKEYANQLTGENDKLLCYADAYVTYMDEQILSVVYHERVSMVMGTDTYESVSLYCLNFDLESGELYDNAQLLNMDENFAIDFRQREVNENGDAALTYYTDQEIQNMLNNPENLVVFFTPMGMEVGLNLDDRVVYVTYEDYQNYLK